MTRIVKAIAVVDEIKNEENFAFSKKTPTTQVIKRRNMDGFMTKSVANEVRSQQSFVDELNRVRVETIQAKAELRVLARALEDAQKEFDQIDELLNRDSGAISAKRDELLELREQAKDDASKIILQAQEQANELEEQAKNNGYLEGFSKGYEDSKQEYVNINQPLADNLERILENISQYEKVQIEKSEQNIIELAVTIARRIIGKELSSKPQTIVSMLHEVISQNKREDFIKITVSPDILPIKVKSTEEVRALLLEMGANISVDVDNEMEEGSCVVETPKGFTDISISTQLNNLQASLLDE